MATVVGLRNGELRSWNNSAGTLDCCEMSSSDYLDKVSDSQSRDYINWKSPSSDTTSSTSPSWSGSLSDGQFQEKQRWKIKQLLHSLQRSWHSQDHVTADQIKHLPFTLFSSVEDRPQNDKRQLSYLGYFTAPNFASSQTSSETELNNVLNDIDWDKSLCYNFHFMRIFKSSRRHCNSDSDLTNDFLEPNMVKPVVQRPMLDISPMRFEAKKNIQLVQPCCSIKSVPTDECKQLAIISPASGNKSLGLYDRDLPIQFGVDLGDEEPESPTEEKRTTTDHFDQHGSTKPSHQRKSSIKEWSESDSAATTPRLNKSVSFADEFGLELVEVFEIESERKVPEYEAGYDGFMWTGSRRARCTGFDSRLSESRLKKRSMTFPEGQLIFNSSTVGSNENKSQGNSQVAVHKRRLWVLNFSQPAAKYYEFRQKIENSAVSLESITLTQPDEASATQLPQLSGTIKVKNLSFEKQVWIRLTVDNWQSYKDYVALYSPKLSSGLMSSVNRFDTFTFQITVVPQLENAAQWNGIEFAIRYLVGPDGCCGQYWDSNGGSNYGIEQKVLQSSWSIGLIDSPKISNFQDELGDGDSHYRPYTPDYRPNFEGITQFTNYRAWRHFSEETTYY